MKTRSEAWEAFQRLPRAFAHAASNPLTPKLLTDAEELEAAVARGFIGKELSPMDVIKLVAPSYAR